MSGKNGESAVEEAAPEEQSEAVASDAKPEEAVPPQGPPVLNPAYVPAQEDSIVLVRFVGNTAQIGDFQTKRIDAFQMLALGSFLEMKGKQTIAAIEAEAYARAQEEARKNAIVVPGRMPTEAELAGMPPGIRPAASSG